MITCFLDGPFIVMLSFGLDLFSLLIILCMFLIFWFLRLGNTSLILSVFLVVLEFKDNAWAYNFLPLLSKFFLKNFEILTTFFRDFAGMGGEIMETEAGFSVSLSFFGVVSLFIWELSYAFTFCLKEKLFLSVIRWFQWDL